MTQAKSICSVLMALAIGGCAITTPAISPSTVSTGPAAHVQATVLQGSPTIRLTLDREYRVQEVRAESPAEASGSELRTWVLVPKDEQSRSASASVAIGRLRRSSPECTKVPS
jgi:hypothetical protein